MRKIKVNPCANGVKCDMSYDPRDKTIVVFMKSGEALGFVDMDDIIQLKREESYEWCVSCKEYNQKAHCCHRWAKQISKTVTDIAAYDAEVLAEASEMNQYKVHGKPETYSKYNEGWQDAVAFLESRLVR